MEKKVKDAGQQMGYRSLEWNSVKATSRPIWARVVAGANMIHFIIII